MGIKGKLLALVMALVLMLAVAASAGAVVSYEVQLPSGHNTSGTKYPVVYLMPQNGFTPNAEDKELAKLLANEGLDMVVVMPQFVEGMDLHAEMADLVAAVDADASLHTIANAKHRAMVGIGNGGYLAYVLGMMDADGKVLTNPDQFAAAASIRGNFADATNPWLKKYGSVYSKLSSNKASFNNFYTYMDAPVDDAWTNMSGSTNDLGSMFISAGTTADNHEYTVRLGEYNNAFMKESAKRITDRLSKWMVRYTFYTSMDSVIVTAADDYAEITYSVMGLPTSYDGAVEHFLANPYTGTIPMKVTVSAYDTKTGEKLATSAPVSGYAKYFGGSAGSLKLKNVTNGQTVALKMHAEALGYTFEIATGNMVFLKDPVVKGDYQEFDLLGNWYFKYTGSEAKNISTLLSSKEYESWDSVTPTLGWWSGGFGNLDSGYETGNSYYVREFVLPEGFDTQNPVISVGYVDDCCQVYINGTLVGSTGFKANGDLEGSDVVTWDVYSYFDVDPSILNYNGEVNTIVVRDVNKSGGGGWYAGPISLYSKKAFDEQNGGSAGYTDRFYEESYYSDAVGAEMDYLIYLPKDYNKQGDNRFYPTMYLLHQFSSTHMSYMGDGVQNLMEEAIKDGLFDEMIVVIPNSDGMSWWKGKWEDMVIEDLIPHIDAKYRTIPDARYRMTAGCSMGGLGAMTVALSNPNYFSGVAGFYGAYDYAAWFGSMDPISFINESNKDYLSKYALAFICGNQDSYGFGKGHIKMNQKLEDLGLDHYFFIENGEHDASFYVPYFKDAVAYVRNNMYKNTSGSAASLINVDYAASSEQLVATLGADEAIRKYFNVIPASKYTENTNPGVTLPVIATIAYEGGTAEVKFFVTFDDNNLSVTETVDLTGIVPAGAAVHNVKFHTQLLGRDQVSDSAKVEQLKVTGAADLPSTGDNSNIFLFAALLMMSVVGMTVMSKKKASC